MATFGQKKGSQLPILQCHNTFGPYKEIRRASTCAFTFAENCPWRLYAKSVFFYYFVCIIKANSMRGVYRYDVFSARKNIGHNHALTVTYMLSLQSEYYDWEYSVMFTVCLPAFRKI